MSELKAFSSERIYWAVEQVERVAGDIDELHLDDNQFYLKSEADKVIAELEETLKNSRNARKYWRKEYLIEYKECLHQKYKRCLAMASRCFTKSNYHFVLARHGEDVKENNRKFILYTRWRRLWLAIAEKFKEVK